MNAMDTFGYRILGQGRRDLHVVAPDGTVVSEVHSIGWMNSGAEGRIGATALRFVPPNAFSTKPFRIELDGRPIGTLQLGWKRYCAITLDIDGRPWPLRFGPKGWFKHGYRLSTAQDVPVLELTTRWKWFASPDYGIDFPAGRTVSTEALPLVLAVAGYAAALMRARQAHAAM